MMELVMVIKYSPFFLLGHLKYSPYRALNISRRVLSSNAGPFLSLRIMMDTVCLPNGTR